MKTALVTGVLGQDGSHLADLLLGKGYRVVGLARRSSSGSDWRVRHLAGDRRFRLVRGDVTDGFCLARLLAEESPDEVYNLAAQSFVAESFSQPGATADATYFGAANCLEAVRCMPPSRRPRLYQASSSEMYGSSWSERNGVRYQDEETPFRPNSPYAVAKLAAHHLARVYRESYGLFVSCGILFNHESERRSPEFVTRKIAMAAAARACGGGGVLRLGNVEARRDWGWAPDYVRGMWMMLQAGEPGDYVLATGESHSVREFAEEAFRAAGVEPRWEVDPGLLRPCEVPYLCGDASRAAAELGWRPTVSFAELAMLMVRAEL